MCDLEQPGCSTAAVDCKAFVFCPTQSEAVPTTDPTATYFDHDTAVSIQRHSVPRVGFQRDVGFVDDKILGVGILCNRPKNRNGRAVCRVGNIDGVLDFCIIGGNVNQSSIAGHRPTARIQVRSKGDRARMVYGNGPAVGADNPVGIIEVNPGRGKAAAVSCNSSINIDTAGACHRSTRSRIGPQVNIEFSRNRDNSRV